MGHDQNWYVRKTVALVDKALNSEAVDAKASEFLHANEIRATAGLSLMMAVEAELPEDAIGAIPKPGTEEVEGSNQPYDKYTTYAGDKKINGSFFSDWADNSKRGKIITALLDAINVSIDKPGTGVEPYSSMNVVSLRGLKGRYEQQRTSLRNLYKRVGFLIHQFRAFDEVAQVTAYPVVTQDREGKTVLAYTSKPICIRGKVLENVTGNDENFKHLTITSFLSIDVDKVVDAGGTWNAVMENMGKGADGTTPDLKSDIPQGNTEVAGEYLSEFVSWCKTPSNFALLTAKIGTDVDTLLNVGDICMMFDSLWTKIEPRYNAENEKRATAMKKAGVA